MDLTSFSAGGGASQCLEALLVKSKSFASFGSTVLGHVQFAWKQISDRVRVPNVEQNTPMGSSNQESANAAWHTLLPLNNARTTPVARDCLASQKNVEDRIGRVGRFTMRSVYIKITS